jgi:hypothetical protein
MNTYICNLDPLRLILHAKVNLLNSNGFSIFSYINAGLSNLPSDW